MCSRIPVSVVVVSVLVEVSWHPAVDWVTNELFGRHKHGEADKYSNRRAMTDTVSVVVITS